MKVGHRSTTHGLLVKIHLAFIDYILSSSVLPVIGLIIAYQFASPVVILFMPTFTVRPVFVQSILTVL